MFVIVLIEEDDILLVVIELVEGFGEELDVLDTVVDLVAVFVPVLVFVLVPLGVSKLVGYEDLVLVVVLVDVFEAVPDNVGWIAILSNLLLRFFNMVSVLSILS